MGWLIDSIFIVELKHVAALFSTPFDGNDSRF